jgi:putative membrane protein
MWGWGPSWGMGSMGGFGVIFWLVILAVIVAGVVWFVRSMPQTSNLQQPAEHRSAGLEALYERYARGEISREEYLQKKHDIGDLHH